MSYNGRTNHLTGNILSDEWYTPQFLVDKCIEIVGEKINGKILLPYDTENSLFVKTLKRLGKTIQYGITDFIESEYTYSLLMTNPPFSLKEKVFEKCLQNNEDFILVLPETFVFSVKFYDLLEKYKFHYELYSPKQRVYFIDENGKQNRPNFHTVIISVSKNYKENIIHHFYSETKGGEGWWENWLKP